MSEPKYLAIDPGHSTGWATFKEDGSSHQYGTCRGRDEVYQLLGGMTDLTSLIMEDYRLYPWKATEQSWSSLETVRVIGAIEYWCWQNQVKTILQEPNVKTIAYLWAGIKKPKNHDLSHETDAYVHGVYYLQKNGIRRPQQGKGQPA